MKFDKEKEALKQRIDQDVRTLYTDERKLNKFQVNEKLLFITNNLWDSFQQIIEPVRKKIQNLESNILVNRYNLDETLKKHCKSKEDFKRAENDLINIEDNLDKHRKQMQKIEEHSYGHESENDLRRLPFWVFVLLMSIVGIAEVIVYYYVFQSQEIMSKQDVYTFADRAMYYGFPSIMAIGFTVMLIWLAHKLGMMLRQYTSIHKKLQRVYWIKFGVISAVVIGAIVVTVLIRGQMHEIMYIQNKIVKLQDASGDMSFDDTATNDMSFDDTATNDMSMNMDSTNDMSMNMDSTDDMSMKTSKPHKEDKFKISIEENNNSLPTTEDGLQLLVTKLKGNLAIFFVMINLFIVIAGIFLAYEVHTSSIKYEALEGMIARLNKRRKKLLGIKNDYEKALSKNEKDELMHALKQYVDSVNTFDEYSQVVKSLKISIENIYIEMVYYMLGTMEEHHLLTGIDIAYIEQFSPEDLSDRFRKEWKLENIDIESDEVMHIHNIDEFIEKFQCSSNQKKEVKDV